jgi:hypothetical protein
VADSCEPCNEISSSKRGGKFYDHLGDTCSMKIKMYGGQLETEGVLLKVPSDFCNF